MSEKEFNEFGPVDSMNVDEEIDDEFNDNDDGGAVDNAALFQRAEEQEKLDQQETKMLDDGSGKLFELPEFTRKDKTLSELLDMMEDNAPIIPDPVIDYYMAKNGFQCGDVRVKRLLALATQKFISDIACDAYEYSRIRSSVAVYNANNGQSRARQLMMGQQNPGQQQISQQQAQQNEKTTASKVVLTVNDLSSAVAEYGLNISRPDFYR
ncbi:hypothetical protein TBLA_0H01090 [Henningerozyma blattae CBS 6284]|uniref:Transcription initiation factor TFIID subunit 10 n=1 Tax=Henningerozyma blattae (strain ATCC 34711 / CBS 6284 / DSM 70876 / NBRC 10599 / NRRL Y-10934 / UCD 77-7) TaxID=1071380 RepID=I2H7P5_HENB6|nr:hypothetical protein TBLA_0H01090 [Tetrapisispora blattae CBS 6284]CCH62397.1 hypothetical protein TBLA_0H01090 [Tetrapisispora blattae CBS 6284]